ncbi:MAG: hypothetical protein IJU37_05705 [Desulfovibrio sp.]|nr:hypothetical protein [Desulfovibrio sp.]
MFAMPKYKERNSLIPGGCPQLLDFEIDLRTLPRIKRSFEEHRLNNAEDAPQIQLHTLEENGDGQIGSEAARLSTMSVDSQRCATATTPQKTSSVRYLHMNVLLLDVASRQRSLEVHFKKLELYYHFSKNFAERNVSC